MKKISILGSTGSIGTQTLDVCRMHPDLFSVEVLAAGRNDERLEAQIHEFHPRLAVLADEAAAKRLRARYTGETEIRGGRDAFVDAAAYGESELVVTAMMGFAGLRPTMAAIAAGKNIALANKETLVVAGEVVTRAAKSAGVSILPVDSEHCAFFQCLQGERRQTVKKLWLTCSGGPFRGKKRADLTHATKAEVLAHPTWTMGPKITVDSATLVNKGLEVIEAKWLYGVSYDEIQVVVHPESIIHSMIEYVDGSVMAQLGPSDMRLPIQYALTYPERSASPVEHLDFWQMRALHFEQPDTETFRGLAFAYEAGRTGGTAPCIFNAANEVAVAAFLAGRIGFTDIYDIIEATMAAREVRHDVTLDLLIDEDRASRGYAEKLLNDND